MALTDFDITHLAAAQRAFDKLTAGTPIAEGIYPLNVTLAVTLNGALTRKPDIEVKSKPPIPLEMFASLVAKRLGAPREQAMRAISACAEAALEIDEATLEGNALDRFNDAKSAIDYARTKNAETKPRAGALTWAGTCDVELAAKRK